MKTKIKGYSTEYWTDDDSRLILLFNGRVCYAEPPDNCMSIKAIESYAKQLLEAVEAAKVVINMSEKG